MADTIVTNAAIFAYTAHEGQKRKYTGRPYIEHPMRVAGKLTLWACKFPVSKEMIAAAWLHDVVEDTSATNADIAQMFGGYIASLVHQLTSPKSDEPRAVRKRKQREALAAAALEVRLIKLVDRTDNLEDMALGPVKFRRQYAEESLLLAQEIGDDPMLAPMLAALRAAALAELAAAKE